jgi:hypothetical protein
MMRRFELSEQHRWLQWLILFFSVFLISPLLISLLVA